MRTSRSRAATARNPVPAASLAMAANPDAGASPAPAATQTVADAAQREAMVRLVAYSFYERRGYIAGNELQDWLLAEMEVERQLAAGSPGTAPN